MQTADELELKLAEAERRLEALTAQVRQNGVAGTTSRRSCEISAPQVTQNPYSTASMLWPCVSPNSNVVGAPFQAWYE